MAIHLRDAETDTLVRQLAKEEGVGLTEAIRMAVREKLEARRKTLPLEQRVRAVQEELASYPRTGLKADKAFYDSLSGD